MGKVVEYKDMTTDELNAKLERYKKYLSAVLCDKFREEGTAEWLMIEIKKIEKELSNC
jgi:hypothetical protein